MQALNRTTASHSLKQPAKILQFGGGNFLRAFTDWMIEVLNQETDFNGNVIIVKPTKRGDYTVLRNQEGLFHTVLEGIKKGEFIQDYRLINCVSGIIHPYLEYEKYLSSAEIPEMRFIISNTTEAGIKFKEEDHQESQPAEEFPGKLTTWLFRRFKYFNGSSEKGCIILPLELIENNGEMLKSCIIQYAEQWNLGEGFIHWIEEHNIFCNTLVDRIVSGYPTERAADIEQSLGYKDELLVAGEYYHSWVIQGPPSIQDELPFDQTDLNVQFVENLTPYREIKVRILNGAHTSMVPVGYLMGIRTVYEAMQSSRLSKFIEDILTEEVIPTLDFPIEESIEFKNDVLDRFRNPSIRHQLISIALNSISKYKTRLLPSLLAFVEQKGALPNRIVFALAALIRFYKGEFANEIIPLKDNPSHIQFFKDKWQKVDVELNGLTQLVEDVLANTDFWGENLNRINGLKEKLVKDIKEIEGLRSLRDH